MATSMGMSPQSGLPQNNRVGDFDVFALPLLMRETGKTLPQLLDELANQLRPGRFEAARAATCATSKPRRRLVSERAQLAIDVYVEAVRHLSSERIWRIERRGRHRVHRRHR